LQLESKGLLHNIQALGIGIPGCQA